MVFKHLRIERFNTIQLKDVKLIIFLLIIEDISNLSRLSWKTGLPLKYSFWKIENQALFKLLWVSSSFLQQDHQATHSPMEVISKLKLNKSAMADVPLRKKNMDLKHWILPNNQFNTHLFFSIFGWGGPFLAWISVRMVDQTLNLSGEAIWQVTEDPYNTEFVHGT